MGSRTRQKARFVRKNEGTAGSPWRLVSGSLAGADARKRAFALGINAKLNRKRRGATAKLRRQILRPKRGHLRIWIARNRQSLRQKLRNGRRDKRRVNEDERRRAQSNTQRRTHGKFGNGLADVFAGREGAEFAIVSRRTGRARAQGERARVFEMRGTRIESVRDLSEDEQERDPKHRFGREQTGSSEIAH